MKTKELKSILENAYKSFFQSLNVSSHKGQLNKI